MSKWVVNTNLGYIAGSSGSMPLVPAFTEDINNATYRDLEEAKVWAGDIISRSLCGVLWVRLVPLGDDNDKDI